MRWLWIDRVVELRPRERLVAIKNVSMAEEHLHDHFPADPQRHRPALPVMPASLIIEGMAQTGGILVGHAEAFREKVILAKVSRAELTRDASPGCTLRYTADVERMDPAGASIRGTVELLDPLAHAHANHPGPASPPDHAPHLAAKFAPIGQIELVFSHLDQNMGGAGQTGSDFPAHNFVFGEAFKTLLRSSGITV